MAHIEIDDEVDDSVEVSDDEIVEESSGSYVLHHGEALAWLRSLSDGYADALVTDPPAGIAFMGKGWDRDKGGRTAWVAWLAEILSQARRCLKPGAAGFVWALPRTSHWTATACEDAGFEVRDVVTHVQGQGFPKSKALLKPAAENWIHVRSPLDIEHWIAIINSSICDLEELWKTVLLEQTDMHLSKETASICLNIVQSWKITLVVLWNAMNTSITKMDNELIIVLRTLNYLLSKITPENMLKDLISADGQKSHVKLVNAYFDALRTSYQNTQTPSAHDIVTAQAVFKKTLAAVSPLAVAEQKTAPGSEHWILVRAPGPLRPLRIDDCRVGTSKDVPASAAKDRIGQRAKGNVRNRTTDTSGFNPNIGRWPANFVMSHVSIACYTLRGDTPREVADAIYAYYGVDEIMRALRNGIPWDAVRPEAAKVLQQGVRWLEPEERAQDNVGADDVPGVRSGIRDPGGLGQERSAAVLHEGMPQEGQTAAVQNGQGAHLGGAADNVGEGDGPLLDGAVKPVEGREVQNRRQILERDDSDATDGCAGTSPTDARREVQVHPGAQDRRGDGARSADLAIGSCASRQRGQGGQSTGEPGGCAEGGPLGAPSRHRAEVGQRAGRSRAASGGKPVFAVASWAIPDGWVKFFQFSHGEGCGDACEEDCPVRLLGEQSGVRAPCGGPKKTTSPTSFLGTGHGGIPGHVYTDTGTAARFFPCFYQPKASKRDRGEGNNHPTVKSVALMRWLVRLVCPVGGLVLDPFTGSGSTGVAALAEGLRFAGCEREAEYVQIARARLDKALP